MCYNTHPIQQNVNYWRRYCYNKKRLFQEMILDGSSRINAVALVAQPNRLCYKRRLCGIPVISIFQIRNRGSICVSNTQDKGTCPFLITYLYEDAVSALLECDWNYISIKPNSIGFCMCECLFAV